jgi:Tfp pilus assembly protein PilV
MKNLSCLARSRAPLFARRTSFNAAPKRFSVCGFMLLEVLISILIVALGFMALLGIEARSFSTTSHVQSRATAMQLTNAFVGEMWAAGLGTATATPDAFLEGGTAYTRFQNAVTNAIPNSEPPVVNIDNKVSGLPDTARQVSVTITWTEEQNDNPIPHNYSQTSIIGLNP